MKCIVGLGNPGTQYNHTRHNIGFMAIDRLSAAWDISVHRRKWEGETGEGWVRGEKVVLCKPQTYMNRSGMTVRPLCDYFKITMDNLVVIYDDLDLPLGQIRLRLKGSAGGHNGMKSIIQHLGTEEFKRIRIGIGRPNASHSVTDYVLQPFAEHEEEPIAAALERVVEAVNCWIDSTFLVAMNQYNG